MNNDSAYIMVSLVSYSHIPVSVQVYTPLSGAIWESFLSVGICMQNVLVSIPIQTISIVSA